MDLFALKIHSESLNISYSENHSSEEVIFIVFAVQIISVYVLLAAFADFFYEAKNLLVLILDH